MNGKTHELKIWPYYFRAVVEGRKKFELRKNDRGGFNAGEILILREWDPTTRDYTGRETRRRVLYVLDGPANGIEAGFSCLSIGPVRDDDDSRPFRYKPTRPGSARPDRERRKK